MHTAEAGIWYDMNAGRRHTAAHFGSEDRVQLVVRQLLPAPLIVNPKEVSITLKQVVVDRRFIFDDIILVKYVDLDADDGDLIKRGSIFIQAAAVRAAGLSKASVPRHC